MFIRKKLKTQIPIVYTGSFFGVAVFLFPSFLAQNHCQKSEVVKFERIKRRLNSPSPVYDRPFALSMFSYSISIQLSCSVFLMPSFLELLFLCRSSRSTRNEAAIVPIHTGNACYATVNIVVADCTVQRGRHARLLFRLLFGGVSLRAMHASPPAAHVARRNRLSAITSRVPDIPKYADTCKNTKKSE